MNSNKLDKWKSLLSDLNINLEIFCGESIEYPEPLFTLDEAKLRDFLDRSNCPISNPIPKDSLSTLNELQLKQFESKISIILPQEYKEFCQVFGAGCFGHDGIDIDCPNLENIEAELDNNLDIPQNWKETCQGWSNEAEQLLDKAYMFGSGGGDTIFVFDLRSYKKEDESYDIYGIGCEVAVICYLGRSFFKFISDYCIGDRDFPELLLDTCEDIDKNDPYYQSTTFFPCPDLEVMAKLDREYEQEREEEYQKAIEDYGKLITISPSNAEAYKNRGIARYNSGDVTGGMEDLQTAIELYRQQDKIIQYRELQKTIDELIPILKKD